MVFIASLVLFHIFISMNPCVHIAISLNHFLFLLTFSRVSLCTIYIYIYIYNACSKIQVLSLGRVVKERKEYTQKPLYIHTSYSDCKESGVH